MRRILLLFFISLFSLVNYSLDIDISANIARELEQLNRIDREILQKKDHINRMKMEKDSIIADMEILKGQIIIKTRHIEYLNQKLQEIKINIQDLTDEKFLLKEKIATVRKSINKRIVNIYKYGQINTLESLFNAEDINDLLSFIMYNRYLLEYENTLLENFFQMNRILKKKEKALNMELLTKEEALKVKNQTLASINRNIQNRNILMDKISSDIEYHQRYLQEIETTSKEIGRFIMELESMNISENDNNIYLSETDFLEEELKLIDDPVITVQNLPDNGDGSYKVNTDFEIETDAVGDEVQEDKSLEEEGKIELDYYKDNEVYTETQEIEQSRKKEAPEDDIQARLERMRALQRKDFESMKGRLKWPYNGRISLRYGKIYNQRHNTYYFHNGIDISANEGSPINSVYYGKVVFADWYRGYGNLIIIDHNDGFYTLYAHLSEFLVNIDDMVEEGDLIAYSGDTGSMKGPILYFEIRRYQETFNPIEWLSRR